MSFTARQGAMVLAFLFLVSSVQFTPTDAQDPLPNVPWVDSAEFELDHAASDEFDGTALDETKWDTHGLRNADTNCPTWNGPLSNGDDSIYSTYYSTSTNPDDPTGPPHREYEVAGGKFRMNIGVKDESFFAAREYYCDPETFTCNHDSSIPCYRTNWNGDPIIQHGEYAGIVHDKCKKEPYCIPHYQYVLNQAERPYRKYTSTHLYGKPVFRYGFFETKLKMAKSSAVTAVWMHGRDSTGDAWCRFRLDDDGKIRRECPSRVKSDRWQEIDLVEAMHTDFHSRRYIPNIHIFACSKGEFSSASAVEDASGGMGGGPIIINGKVKNDKLFGHVPPEQRVSNSFHMRSGSVYELDEEWGEKERTIGVYWSSKRICFYVDGVEVFCVDNTLVHQPMSWDISAQLNVAWAMQLPASDAELLQYAEIDYVRAWKVFTPEGADPPLQVPLNDVMIRKFNPLLYGSSLLGVHNVFPDNDDRTVVLQEEEEEPTEAMATVESEEDAGQAAFTTRFRRLQGSGALNVSSRQTMAQLYGLEEGSIEVYSRMTRYEKKAFAKKAIKKSKKEKKRSKKLMKLKKRFPMLAAGGKPGLRGRRKLKKMKKKERLGEAARPDRAVGVRRVGGKIVTGFLETAPHTYLDWFNPMTPGAAHATFDGNGEEL